MSQSLMTITRSLSLLLLATAGLVAARYWGSYLLFHVLVELFSILVLSSLFVVTWNTRRRASHGYLSLMGLAALFIAALELVHTLAFRGMNVIPGVTGANEATQLWIALGILKAITLLIAPLFVNRKVNAPAAIAVYAIAISLILLSIFAWSVFPICYVEGKGLTPFKIYAEYAICALLLAAAAGWWAIRHSFSPYVRHMLLAALVAMIVSELVFTFYVSVDGPLNMAGHALILLSSYLLYKAIVQTALTDPMDLLLRDLQIREQELQRHVSELDEARKVAEEASRAKGQFLAVLSHELRTPLTPVLASVSDLLMEGRAPAHLHETLTMIQRNVELQTRLVDDLLDLTRVDRGKIRLDRLPADVHDSIRHAADTCRSEYERKNVHLELCLQASLSWTTGDSARLEQIIWNLLTNARKFTPAGGQVTVRTFNEQKDSKERLIIEVSDTGVGMDLEAQTRLFVPFEQANEHATRAGGLGLGLAITRGMVRLHGGSIVAHSAGAGKGSTFTVKLPTIARPPVTAKTPPPPAQPGEIAVRRILLVEDHADTARVIGQLLRRDGHVVEIAGDVASARRLFDKDQCDLVISDIGLPDGNGLDLLRVFRSERPSVPAICMSGYGSEQDLRASGEAGSICHLIKPVTMQRLRQAIRDSYPQMVAS